MRRFKVVYIRDEEGVEPRVIGYGCTMPDGSAVVRYETTGRTLVAATLADLEESLVDVDTHSGDATVMEWID